MRKRFEQQMELGILPIDETPVLEKCRDDVPALVKALLKIYTTTKYNNNIFSILEDKVLKGKQNTGRKGMNLWQIFVLDQFRLALNLDYDRLHYMVNSDSTMRQLLGVATATGFQTIMIGRQRVIDNVTLLDDQTLVKINQVIVEMGHDVFKKKDQETLSVKTDSFVVETNVHFPTDYNLLWDSTRKALDVINWFTNNYKNIKGWRKSNDWFRGLKNYSRAVGRVSASGGKNKDKRLKKVTREYLLKAKTLIDKIVKSKDTFPSDTIQSAIQLIQLNKFIDLIDKHIDLLERRVIKAEKIPHQEKLFSIFEQYTDWITKGKSRPSVELGKMLSITTDQYGIIIDYYVMENQTDSQIVKSTAKRITSQFNLQSWSFDKGFWNKENKAFLEQIIPQVIMPKKGKRNKEETQQEREKEFKRLKHKHSAVESNINELEHKGLDRCPDRGYPNFKRYIAMGITAYNLHRIGKELIKQEEIKARKKKKRAA